MKILSFVFLLRSLKIATFESCSSMRSVWCPEVINMSLLFSTEMLSGMVQQSERGRMPGAECNLYGVR